MLYSLGDWAVGTLFVVSWAFLQPYQVSSRINFWGEGHHSELAHGDFFNLSSFIILELGKFSIHTSICTRLELSISSMHVHKW